MLTCTGSRPRLVRLVALLIGLTLGLAGRHPALAQPHVAQAHRGMVVTVSAPASDVGQAILRDGGNAVDAAVATALALAVTYPQAGNLGGGGFMMILPGPGKAPVCVEYRETAPAAATPRMFTLGESRHSPKAAGVPGTMRGLALAHAKHGRLPWNKLVQPAVKLAEEGFLIDKHLSRSLNELLSSVEAQPFEELRRVFAPPNGQRWRRGDRLIQGDLAGTLRQIEQQGADAFYTGKIARQIVAAMRADPPGLISLEDLAQYQAKIRRPIHCSFRSYDIYGPPPPSSGGICLAIMLNTLENFDLRSKGRWSPATLHLLTETMRRAFLDRARFLGDSDFVDIPAHLTSKEYAAKLARQIDRRRATPSDQLAPELQLAREGNCTTHFSVVDEQGMAVSNTYTLEQSYGSLVVVPGAGFLLNNEMGDFNWTPGRTDRKGRIGTAPNLIAPGKRMLSSQTPVLVTRNGRALLVTGSPGGRTIINTTLSLVLNVLEFEMSLPAAVKAPRFHHQWFPDEIQFEPEFLQRHASAVEQLRQMGHRVSPNARRQGDAHSILVDGETGRLLGVADDRISGKVSGW